MIRVSRRQHQPLVINADRIETVEQTPDTVITLSSGKRIIVDESADDVVALVVAYRQRCLNADTTVARSRSPRRPSR